MASAARAIVLVSCGSFNPVTNMHLRLFERARDFFRHEGRCRVIGGIVSPVSDHYIKPSLIPAAHRVAMLRGALADSNWIALSDWETQQPEWTRTARVLSYFEAQFASAAPTDPAVQAIVARNGGKLDEVPEVKLLCGADLLQTFATPGLWAEEDIEAIVARHGLVVLTRAGTDPGRFVHESDTLWRHANNIRVVTEWILNEVSSTEIRRAVSRGQSIKYLVPVPVSEYIDANGLYRAD